MNRAFVLGCLYGQPVPSQLLLCSFLLPANIIIILRRANSRYTDVASRIRASLRPTFHARKRAAELRLGVDIGKAIRCEQRQVSIVPLPVLDLGTSPVTGTIEPIVPIICNGNSNSKKRPVLRCAIPTHPVIHQPRQLASSISRYRLVTDGRPFPPHHLPSSPVDNTPVEATPIGDEEINTSLFVDVKGLISWNFTNTDVSSASSTESRLTFPSSCSSSASETNGPLTPDVYDVYPLLIRTKRKSANAADVDTLEKRPKFEKKEWPSPAVQRNVVRIPSRRQT